MCVQLPQTLAVRRIRFEGMDRPASVSKRCEAVPEGSPDIEHHALSGIAKELMHDLAFVDVIRAERASTETFYRRLKVHHAKLTERTPSFNGSVPVHQQAGVRPFDSRQGTLPSAAIACNS